MKKRTFFVGLLSGVVLSQTWRPLAKTGIKLGILVGYKAREISQQALEDIGDMAAEAKEEVKAQAARGTPYQQEPNIAYDPNEEIN